MDNWNSGGTRGEAIIYAYYSFIQLIQSYYNITRRQNLTAREFAMELVRRIKMPPATIYPFTNLYEQARFSDKVPDTTNLTEALQLFFALREKIVGGALPIVPEPTQTD
jgi:hypothetical protein